MPEILNLDALTCELVDVQKRGRHYELRDDIPFDIMVRVFRLRAKGQALQAVRDEAEAEVAFEALRADVLGVFTAIVRHTLPEETADGLGDTFSFDDQMRVIELFFLRRSRASQPPASDSMDAGSASKASKASKGSRGMGPRTAETTTAARKRPRGK